MGDLSKARTSYENFFAIWKDADPDIPILIQAKKEYAKLPAKKSYTMPTIDIVRGIGGFL